MLLLFMKLMGSKRDHGSVAAPVLHSLQEVGILNMELDGVGDRIVFRGRTRGLVHLFVQRVSILLLMN